MSVLIRHLRARAGRYALALAVCQVAVLFSATMLAASRSGALTVAADEECSCEHSTGVMCPMHRRSASRPVPANTPRWCKGVDGSTYAVLPVLGTLALPERLARLSRPTAESIAAAPRAEATRPLPHPPDSPPPRA